MRRYSCEWNTDFAEVKTGAGSFLLSLFKKCLLEDQSKHLILQV